MSAPVAGSVCWHPQETTHYLGGGRYIVVRRAWSGGWLVEESDGFGSRILDSADIRGEADAVAQMYAAIRPLHTDEVSS